MGTQARIGSRLQLTVLFAVIALLPACDFFRNGGLPDTQGQNPATASSFGYTPLDPVPVEVTSSIAGRVPTREVVLDALADETMRIAIGTREISGGLTFGAAALSAKDGRYVIILDYGKSSTIPIPAVLSRTGAPAAGTFSLQALSAGQQAAGRATTTIPMFVGVGLRLTAEITTQEAGINLGSLVAIGAAADAKRLSGTMVLQTLGISGKTVSFHIPFPSAINESTIQTAIQALGAIKTRIYDPEVTLTPRILGINNFAGVGRDEINRFVVSALENRPNFAIKAADN